LTQAKASNWAPQWSPDGKLLAFYSDRAGTAALWLWSSATGQIRRVSDLVVRPWGSSIIVWAPDGRSVFVPVLPEGITIESAAEGSSGRLAEAVPLAGLGISAGWTPNGKLFAYTTGDGHAFLVPPSGGAPRRVTETPVEGLSLDFSSVPWFDGPGEWMVFE